MDSAQAWEREAWDCHLDPAPDVLHSWVCLRSFLCLGFLVQSPSSTALGCVGLPRLLSGKRIHLSVQETPIQSGSVQSPGKGRQPTPVFLPRKFHGQKN